jgi:hypothetical protein
LGGGNWARGLASKNGNHFGKGDRVRQLREALTPADEGTTSERDQGGAEQAEEAGADEWLMVREGSGYLIAGTGERGHFARLKGLAMIELLVRLPNRPVPMVLLVGGTGQQPPRDKRSKQPAMDMEALQQAYDQLSTLNAEIAEAESESRTLEAVESRDERKRLLQQLCADVGVIGKGSKGKVRDLNNLADKLRPCIHGNLARVYAALRKATPPMPKLATHLESAITSEGLAFVYRPPIPVAWQTTLPQK